jgi:hypothetical protein
MKAAGDHPSFAFPMKQNARPKKLERTTNSKPVPHIPLPFEEVMKDVLKVKPPERPTRKRAGKRSKSS